MAVQYAITTRNNRLDEVIADAGASAWLQFWNGAVPATPVTAPAGTLLASCAMSNPIAPAASSGVLTCSGITSDTDANASGTPTFCRISTTETGTTSGIVQMSAASPSGGDINIDQAIVATGTVAVSGLTITDGSS